MEGKFIGPDQVELVITEPKKRRLGQESSPTDKTNGDVDIVMYTTEDNSPQSKNGDLAGTAVQTRRSS